WQLACSPLSGYRRLRLKVSLRRAPAGEAQAAFVVPGVTALRLDPHNPQVRLNPEEKQLHLPNNPAPLRRRAVASCADLARQFWEDFSALCSFQDWRMPDLAALAVAASV